MRTGWYQIGFLRDFEEDITPVAINKKPYMVIRTEEEYALYEATCPHRGANLAKGGKLIAEGMVCPFHGCVVGLVCPSDEGYQVNRHPLLVVDGLVFTKNDNAPGCGFQEFMEHLSSTHIIIPGFTMEVTVEPELVIENAFDQMHFMTVHLIKNEPKFEILSRTDNAFSVKGTFVIPPSVWQTEEGEPLSDSAAISVPYEATAFSPYTVVSRLQGRNPYYIITSARLKDGAVSAIYLSIGIPNDRFDENEIGLYKYLIDQSYYGLEKDKVIWENLDTDAVTRYRPEERSVIGFRQFCKLFPST